MISNTVGMVVAAITWYIEFIYAIWAYHHCIGGPFADLTILIRHFGFLVPYLNYFGVEHPWWRLIQKRTVHTTFDIWVFINWIPIRGEMYSKRVSDFLFKMTSSMSLDFYEWTDLRFPLKLAVAIKLTCC